MLRVSVVVFLSAILSACVVNPHPPERLAANVTERSADGSVVCKLEKPTGSNRPVRVCRLVAGSMEREETQRKIRHIHEQSERAFGPAPNVQ